jgi:hypothetical protein
LFISKASAKQHPGISTESSSPYALATAPPFFNMFPQPQ